MLNLPRKQDGSKRQRTMQQKRIMRMGTWNVQGIRIKERELMGEIERMKIDICVLTETKQKGKGNERKGNYMKFYSGVPKDNRAQRGVFIMIHKNFIKNWEKVDDK